jgi:glycosyltransferase involved in cell wall biosynthesis
MLMLAAANSVSRTATRPAPAPRPREAEDLQPLLPPRLTRLPSFTPENTEFVLVSFEGPDPYCRAGGLGVRATELAGALAARGFETHFYFLGAPDALPVEKSPHAPLTYHRWAQWLSRLHPGGVYDGEWAKIQECCASLPAHLLGERVRPAVRKGRRVVILSEEWHTAPTACAISDTLWRAGVRDRAVMVWNANNTFGFEHVDFPRLRFTQAISTVSRWMKHGMWNWGCDPIVLPNGIPTRRLEPSPLAEELAETAQDGLKDRLMLGKVARFDPDKRWVMAIQAVAGLKRNGFPVLFLARGGVEAHGHEVMERARAAGLVVREVRSESRDPRMLLRSILAAAEGADVLNLQFHLCEPLARALFRVADAMLQNSGREPFGLVGLEVMAAGGLLFAGATGEEYAHPCENAVVLDSNDPQEIEATLIDLLMRPAEAERLREGGLRTARHYTWDRVVDLMLRRLQMLAEQA